MKDLDYQDKLVSEEYSIVSCGTMRPELESLKKKAFLALSKIFYTAPGLHENPGELEKQLKKQLDNAKKYSAKIIVVYGGRCFVDTSDPSRDIDTLIKEIGDSIKRIKAKNCIDMLLGADEREKIKAGDKVYWLSPGWLKYWRQIFKDWDTGKANETFPQHDKAVVLDSLGIYEEYSANSPEKLLEFADWMKLNIGSHKVSLDRLKRLFLDQIF